MLMNWPLVSLWYFDGSFDLGSFPVCGRVANVTIIIKGPPSSSGANYRPISLTPIMYEVFERLVSVCLGQFMECRGVLPAIQFAYRKGLGTCDVRPCVEHTFPRKCWYLGCFGGWVRR